MASLFLCKLLARKRCVEIIRYSLVSVFFLRVRKFSVFGNQSVTNLTTSRLKDRPARLKSSSKAVIEINSKTSSGSANRQSWLASQNSQLPWQDRPACHLRNRKQNHSNIIAINSIKGRTKPLFYRASVVKYKFDSLGERTKTTDCQNNSQLSWQNWPT